MLLPNQINALRSKYGIDERLFQARHQSGFFVRRYRMLGQEIVRAHIKRALTLNLPSGGRMRKTTWLTEDRAPRKAPEENPVLVDSFEYGSFAEAEQALWSFLGEFHVPVDLQTTTEGVGDVGFVTPDDRTVAFLRGNSLHRISQENPTQDLHEMAASVDAKLTDKPDGAHPEPALFKVKKVSERPTIAARMAAKPEEEPTIAAQFAIEGMNGDGAAQTRAASTTDEADSDDGMLRIFTKAGWIEDDDGLRFNLNAGENAKDAEIEVFEDRADGACLRCRRRLQDEDWVDDA
ncbi:hypothetical protein [uncultured Tateyamaria sp.]|uniref:hypothetical protein n=1 Tax=uncultured Tateyamaria sp. TaxID=455651 RepID=UPI0026281020|nr:hypothetical protein [uncultured Tateyamaria sp.]